MDYVEKLKQAHETGGAEAVAKTVLVVMQGIALHNGRYDHTRYIEQFDSDGNGPLIPSFDFCNTLMGNIFYYMTRDRSDTPLKQIRFLLELFRLHADYKRKTPAQYEFMFDAIAYAMDENIKLFNTAQSQQEAKHGLGGKLGHAMVKLSDKLIQYDLDGPNIDQFKRRTMIAKLSK